MQFIQDDGVNRLQVMRRDVIAVHVQWHLLLDADVVLALDVHDWDAAFVQVRGLVLLGAIRTHFRLALAWCQHATVIGYFGGQYFLERTQRLARRDLDAVERSLDRRNEKLNLLADFGPFLVGHFDQAFEDRSRVGLDLVGLFALAVQEECDLACGRCNRCLLAHRQDLLLASVEAPTLRRVSLLAG